jgi:hypothetical protein
MRRLTGIDIGSPTCGVVLDRAANESVAIIDKVRFLTPPTFTKTLNQQAAR